MNEEVQMVVIDEAHNLEDRVRSATTERHGQRQLINAINASIKSVRGEDREYVLEEADSAIRAVRALFGSARGPSMRTKPQPRNPLGHYQKRNHFGKVVGQKTALTTCLTTVIIILYPGVAQLVAHVIWVHGAGRSNRPTRTKIRQICVLTDFS